MRIFAAVPRGGDVKYNKCYGYVRYVLHEHIITCVLPWVLRVV